MHSRHPYPALYNLDKKIEALCPDILSSSTYFVEAGANDGYHQSNTYFLEKIYGARGLLIEPCLNNYERLITNRSSTNHFSCCALVGPDYQEKYVELIYSNLMTCSTIAHESDLGHSAECHYEIGKQFLPQPLRNNAIYFCALGSTLTKELERANAPKDIGLLSLDLEGQELQALKGLDLNKWRPRESLDKGV
jgi:FkbM family methyltransferase